MEDNVSIAILTLNVTISLVGVLGNGFVIAAFLSKRGLRTQSNYFMISLVILSFIHCAVFYPIQALIDIGVIVGQAFCFPIGCIGFTESVAITLCLLATSTERYIAICWPLSADSILTSNRIVATFVIIAMYSITSGIIFPSLTWIGYEGGAFNDRHSRCTIVSISPTIGYAVWMGVNWLAPIPIMFTIYCRIFFIVRRHVREINAQTQHLNTISFNLEENDRTRRASVRNNKVHPSQNQADGEENELNLNVENPSKRHERTSCLEGREQSLPSSNGQQHLKNEIPHNKDSVPDPRLDGNDNFEHRDQIQIYHLDRNSSSDIHCRSVYGEGGAQDDSNQRFRGVSSSGHHGADDGSCENGMTMETTVSDHRTTVTIPTAAANVDGHKHVTQRKRRNRLFKREMKSAFVVFAIVVLYSFNFIPFVVYLFTNVVSRTPDLNQFAIIHAILFANYALNPYIYGFGNRNVRHTIKNMICRTRRERRLGGLNSLSETLS